MDIVSRLAKTFGFLRCEEHGDCLFYLGHQGRAATPASARSPAQIRQMRSALLPIRLALLSCSSPLVATLIMGYFSVGAAGGENIGGGLHEGNNGRSSNAAEFTFRDLPESQPAAESVTPSIEKRQLADDLNSISSIDFPFLQNPEEFGLPQGGVSLQALGEPKSGTTWLGRIVPSLALELCGSFNNLWCEMGGLIEHPNRPASWYEFELLNRSGSRQGAEERAPSPTLHLHFKGSPKHIIPGSCKEGGTVHPNFFKDGLPCSDSEPPTRQHLESCFSKTSIICLPGTASGDSAASRAFVIFRDPRDVVRSAYKMRTEVYQFEKFRKLSLEQYIEKYFESVVAWQYYRWMWHTSTVLAPASHVLYYEELQGHYLGLIGMAAFMGLQCSHEQAKKVWESHQMSSHHADYSTSGLSEETIDWMTAVMARLLPPSVALQWGVVPTDLF